jgi:hypothetical protein
MGRKKLFRDGNRICSKCDSEESTEHPFPPTGNQCKSCLQEYNTVYIRNKRGHKSRSEKLTLEERHANKLESARQWRANNPEQAKLSTKKQHDKRPLRKLKSDV